MNRHGMWPRALFISVAMATTVQADEVIPPEVATTIRLSNTDVNRVNCSNGDITDVKYSEEKGVKVEYKGSNAFVKFMIKRVNGVEQRVAIPNEFIFTCAGDVYTIIGQPTNELTSVTARLASGEKNKIKANIETYGPMAHEERVVTLIRAAIKDEIGTNFLVENKDGKAAALSGAKDIFNEIAIRPRRTVRVEGLGYRLSEYFILAKRTIELTETDFLSNDFGVNIVGVTVAPLSMKAGEQGRLFIVEQESK